MLRLLVVATVTVILAFESGHAGPGSGCMALARDWALHLPPGPGRPRPPRAGFHDLSKLTSDLNPSQHLGF